MCSSEQPRCTRDASLLLLERAADQFTLKMQNLFFECASNKEIVELKTSAFPILHDTIQHYA